MRHTGAYSSWIGMRYRCEKSYHIQFKDYGGRGISVCERWQLFENFFADMGHRPENASIDRIDNDGDYTPENCRWANRKQQSRNTSKNVFYEFDGRKMILADWGEELGFKRSTLAIRLHHGWSIRRAFTTPV